MSTSLRQEHIASVRFRVLRLLEQNPARSQRDLAAELGVSVGKVNHLLKHLVDQGHLRPSDYPPNVRKAQKGTYLLTPEGIQQRQALTRAYLAQMTREYEALHAEIASLRAEVAGRD